ncbi:MAG: helix-turn-helix domain-containing protein [Actinobacteria bacterium]|nr:helix-turn-helix domain-containing protein [Actinomycetota bacterium]MBV8481102.1 helix-turn-helix domain-containing protein [Actinomycetota bacterium]
MNAPLPSGLQDALAELGADLGPALERIPIPAYLIGSDGTILWVNDDLQRLLGVRVGESVYSHVAPESREKAREMLATKRLTGKSTHYEISVLDGAGRRISVDISSVPLENGSCFVGVFGLVTPPGRLQPKPPPALEPHLTPRQHDVLRLLGQGSSTTQIAKSLGISQETARNHVRGLLKRLRQSSRVAAVAYARAHGLL